MLVVSLCLQHRSTCLGLCIRERRASNTSTNDDEVPDLP